MSNQIPPQVSIDFSGLPQGALERHEAFVEVFGRYLYALRNSAVEANRRLAESESAREKLGTIRRRKYDELAALSAQQRDLAIEVSRESVDRFAQLLLTLLAGTGVDLRLDGDHAVRFKLDLEVCDVSTVEVVETETINRGGKKFFADYWGRWINRFASRES